MLGLVGLMGCVALQPAATPPALPSNVKFSKPDQANRAQVIETYGKLPLSFEANQGQTDAQVKFLSRGRGYTLFLTATEAVMVLATTQTHGDVAKGPIGQGPLSNPKSEIENQKSTVLRMKLLGANPEATALGLEELPGKVNYFIGNDPKKWRKKVPTYAKVKYQDVYPGVDLVYYGNQQQLEYDFVVAPGADPRAIKLAFEGADKVEINAAGHLELHTATGQIQLQKPLVYQEVDGIRREISGAYLLNPKSKIGNDLTIQNPKSEIENGTVGFQVAAYDTTKPLIIDPVLSYSTYLGRSGGEFGNRIAVDAEANAYVTGFTSSTNFPTTPGAFDRTFNGGFSDAFVTKLNPEGTALIYSTFLGGSSFDEGMGIAVDADGNAYVTGVTESTNFPTTPEAFDRTCGTDGNCNGGFSDTFVVKLNPSGSALIYSTFLGGNNDEEGRDIAVDAEGNAYVTGWTSSSDFPTEGAFQTTLLGSLDVFVTKLNPNGAALVYSTYVGGSGGGFAITEAGFGIAVDAEGNAYVTGSTDSMDFPTTPGAFQTTYGGGTTDAFVAKLNPDGSSLIYSTYLGGSGGGFPFNDAGFGIAVDVEGNAYVTGVTSSTNFPTTPGAFQPSLGGDTDAFVLKLNPDGSALLYSTFLGGSGSERGTGITVDSSGNAHVTGSTSSANFPTANPLQPTLGGGSDAYVTKLNPEGRALIYSTYLGGSDGDGGNGIAVDAKGNAYVTGETRSTNFPTTPGAFQTSFGGGDFFGGDAFIAKIADTPAVAADLALTKIDSPDPVTVGDNLTYTITITNDGPDAATGVMLTDMLPGGVILISATPTQGSCAEANGVVTCDLGKLPAGASAIVDIIVTPTEAGEISNTADAVANEPDPDLTNNTAVEVTTVTAP